MKVWLIQKDGDGLIELIAPNGELLFVVSADTADRLGRMLIDMAGLEEDDSDLE